MKSKARMRLAIEYGDRLEKAQAARGHSAQQTHDRLIAKGLKAVDVRNIQRHVAGDSYPWSKTRRNYAVLYPELAE